MLYRKLEASIEKYLKSDTDKILLVSGARQIGKSFLIRHVGKKLFRNYVEINLIADKESHRVFESVKSVSDFYFALASFSESALGNNTDTLIFLDEIQEYPHLLTLLKFLREDNRYRYVASGSQLGISLKKSASVPLGSIDILNMYPLDFEEFLYANGFGKEAVVKMHEHFIRQESLPEGLHNKVMDIYRRYLLVGGLPEAVNKYLETRDLIQVRHVQRTIMQLYQVDASKYDQQHHLKIARIYSLIPSNMENKKKRVVFKEIDGKRGSRAEDYEEEMEYLISSGIALEVAAISNPKFPLVESSRKNLLKLYLNDPGLLTALLYRENPLPILNTERSINLGSVYECAVACQLAANDNRLYYYDNKSNGEVDFLFDDYASLSVVPIEVKSGKDYKRHVALSRFLNNKEYGIVKGYVISNSREVENKNGIIYLPIYYTIFFNNSYLIPRQILI